MDRVREVPAGQRSLCCCRCGRRCGRFMQMGLAQAQALAKVPPEAKQFLEMLNLVSAVELTLNVSAPGPSSLVVHCNDDAAAQKVEATMQEAIAKTCEPPSRPNSRPATIRLRKRWNGMRIACGNYFNRSAAAPALRAFILTGKIRHNSSSCRLALIGIAWRLRCCRQFKQRAVRAMRTQAAPGAGGPPEAPAHRARRSLVQQRRCASIGRRLGRLNPLNLALRTGMNWRNRCEFAS